MRVRSALPLLCGLSVCLALLFCAPTPALAVGKAKVLKDFKSQYELPEGRKLLSTKFLGKKRRFRQVEGIRSVPYVAYKVQVDNLFTDCGLKVRYVWEVWYRKGREFRQIAIFSHKFLNAPKPPAPLSTDQATELIKKGWEKGSGHYTTKVVKVDVTKQTPGWNFCFPKWELEFSIQLTSGKSHETVHDFYECKALATVTKKKDDYEVNTNDCVDPKTGKKTQCFYANHCKKLGTKNAVSAISWGDVAKKALEKGLCEYTAESTMRDCKLAEVKLLKEGEPTKDAKKRWFKVNAVLSFDESNRGRRERTDPWRVNSRYRCFVDVELEYSTSYEGNWGASTEMKWCRDESGPCDVKYTSNLAKVCTCLEPAAHCKAKKAN